jgi:hypothetical protein
MPRPPDPRYQRRPTPRSKPRLPRRPARERRTCTCLPWPCAYTLGQATTPYACTPGCPVCR